MTTWLLARLLAQSFLFHIANKTIYIYIYTNVDIIFEFNLGPVWLQRVKSLTSITSMFRQIHGVLNVD
jgi:hypothetical protein